MGRRERVAIYLPGNPLLRESEAGSKGGGMRRWGRIAFWTGVPALAALLTGATPATRPARWPLDLPPVLTSTFGEYRSQHLHAGIDLGTGGRIGVPCYAVGDGSIVRLRMSPYGYGKALYLQLDNGPLIVYAHLSRFAPAAAQRARAEQESTGRYTFDVGIPPAQMRVRRGEIVAWSGQTGVGLPHLHFEVRDGDVARNPQTAGFPVADAVAPVIEDVTIHPLDAGSHVEGESVARKIPASGALRAGGRLAFSVRTWDSAVRGGHHQGPYRLELRVDGVVLYRSTAERFDYSTNHLLVLEYDQERLTQAGERALWLWRRPGNRLFGREDPAGTAGVLHAPAVAGPRAPGFQAAPGTHTLEVEVADVAGNTTVRRFPLRISARPSIAMLHGRADGDGLGIECRLLDADLLATTAAAAESLSLVLNGSRDGGATWLPLPAERAESDHRGLWRWTARWPDAGRGDLAVRATARDRSGLEVTRTWTTGARHELEGESELTVEVRPAWRTYGLEVDLEAATLLEATPSVYVLRSDGRREPLVCTQRGVRSYRAVGTLATLASGSDALEVQARALDGRRASFRRPLRSRIVRRSERAQVRDLDPRVDIEIGAGAALDDVVLRIEAAPAVDLGAELRPAGTAFMLEPRSAAFDRAVRVRVQPIDGANRTPGLGLFSLDRSGSLRFLTAERDADGGLAAETRFLGAMLVLADSTPPVIGAVRVAALRPARLVFTVLDRGADLGDGGITATLDGAVAIPEWDPETGAVTIEPGNPLAPGAHTLHVVASDRVGNRAERTLNFKIP